MSLEIILIVLVNVLIIIIIVLLLKLNRPKSDSSLNLLQEQILNLNKSFDDKLGKTSELIDKKLSESSRFVTDNISKTFETSAKINKDSNKVIEDITKKLVELENTNKQIKDIGSQLNGLENILKNPKQRGNLGEYFLKELLENVFITDQYKLQYQLGDVGIVDAALFVGDKIIPIDSKFPQENYERLISSEDDLLVKKYSSELKKDIKNRIDETSKYIVLEEGTTDFAFMLIPAEGLYYDIFINKIGDINSRDLIEYAFSKKVIICSPSSFYAYLQTVIQGLKSLQIEQKAKEIQKYVIKLQKDLSTYEENFAKLGSSLSTTVNHYNNAYKRLKIIDKDIVKITDKEAGGGVEPLEIDKPSLD